MTKGKTANKPKAAGARTERGRFAAGASGNPGGRPRSLVQFRLAARAQSRAALAVLVGIMRDKRASASARVRAADALLDRAFGKPTQELLVEGSMLNLGVSAPEVPFSQLSREDKLGFAKRIAFTLAAADQARKELKGDKRRAHR